MPTGYTAGVADGEVTSFREFAMGCARAFGALILMRDDPPNAEIPDRFEPSPYNAQGLVAARERLATLQSLDSDSVRRQAATDYDKALAAHRDTERQRAEKRSRYEAMLDRVLAWEPPTPDHVEMKSFMVQQLEESIRFDCDHDWPAPSRSGYEPKTWLAGQIAQAERDVEYHGEQAAKERERAEQRTEWVRALRSSLSEVES